MLPRNGDSKSRRTETIRIRRSCPRKNDPQQSNPRIEPDQLKPNRIIERVRRNGPRSRPFEKAEIQAAVFVLLVERDEPNLLFIRRAERGDPWSGQIAFPGGRVEDQDGGYQTNCISGNFRGGGYPRKFH